VVPAGEFPTDRYVVEGVAAQRGLRVRFGTEAGPDTAVVVRSMVDYRTAEVVDVAAAQAGADAAGAHAVWDLSHAAGAVPVDLDGWGVGLAAGCTYKYLNGGPGSPAWLYAARRCQELRSPIQGWFGQRDQFAMGPAYDPEPGIRRWLAGTPTVVALAVVDAAVGELAAVGIEALRTKSVALTELATSLADEHGITVGSPRDPAVRGSHVALLAPGAAEVTARLREAHGVVVDFREPDVLRLGLAPATTAFVDVWDGIAAVATVLGR
jgi:kynureninase